MVTLVPSQTTAGSPLVMGTIEEEELGTPVQGNADTIFLSSTDSMANFQPYYVVLNNGVGTFSMTPVTAGPQTVTATDSILKEQATATVTVAPSAVTQFALSASSAPIEAGTAVTFTVTAEDAYSNAFTGYSGTVHFTSSDLQAVLPADAVLTGGVGVFSATLKTAGTVTLTATDTATGTITGFTTASVNPGQPAQFGIRDPIVTAGTGQVITVTALDSYGNPALFFDGTVHFTSSDSQADLPNDATITTSTSMFSITLKSAGIQTITAADLADVTMTGSAAFTVNPAQAARFAVTSASGVTAGNALPVTVTALDSFGNIANGYAGSVNLTSSDPSASLPAASTLTNGSGTFLLTLKSGGPQTLTAADTANGALTGSATVSVTAAAATHFVVTAPAGANAGVLFVYTVTAKDNNNATVTNYSGVVHITSSDALATLTGDATLTGGIGTFAAVLRKSGAITLTGTDVAAQRHDFGVAQQRHCRLRRRRQPLCRVSARQCRDRHCLPLHRDGPGCI